MIPTLMDGFEGFKSSVEKVTANVVETARELELEVKPEDATELFQSHDKILTDEELFFMDKQRTWFLEAESTPGEDAMTSVEMTAKDLEYDINLVTKQWQGLRKLIPILKEVLLWVKFYQTALRASLVAQWLRICLPMQETRVRALVWEDPTCRGATRPVSHGY